MTLSPTGHKWLRYLGASLIGLLTIAMLGLWYAHGKPPMPLVILLMIASQIFRYLVQATDPARMPGDAAERPPTGKPIDMDVARLLAPFPARLRREAKPVAAAIMDRLHSTRWVGDFAAVVAGETVRIPNRVYVGQAVGSALTVKSDTERALELALHSRSDSGYERQAPCGCCSRTHRPGPGR